MFYSALNGNGEKLDSLEASIPFLSDGNIRVIGYGDDFNIVKIRCNRVKSELIVRYGLKEESFTTSLKAGTFDGISDVVVITLPVPETCSRETQPEESATVETVSTAEETTTEETVCTVPEETEEPVNNLPPETTQLSDNPVTEPERPEEKRADGFRGHWQAGLNIGIPFFWGDMLSMAAGDYLLSPDGMTWYVPRQQSMMAYSELYSSVSLVNIGLSLDVNINRCSLRAVL